jgi:hypothetical protein
MTNDEIRGVVIALLDKCHQLERICDQLPAAPLSADIAASVRAYRESLRTYLTQVRDLERAERAACLAGKPGAPAGQGNSFPTVLGPAPIATGPPAPLASGPPRREAYAQPTRDSKIGKVS